MISWVISSSEVYSESFFGSLRMVAWKRPSGFRMQLPTPI